MKQCEEQPPLQTQMLQEPTELRQVSSSSISTILCLHNDCTIPHSARLSDLFVSFSILKRIVTNCTEKNSDFFNITFNIVPKIQPMSYK